MVTQWPIRAVLMLNNVKWGGKLDSIISTFFCLKKAVYLHNIIG